MNNNYNKKITLKKQQSYCNQHNQMNPNYKLNKIRY